GGRGPPTNDQAKKAGHNPPPAGHGRGAGLQDNRSTVLARSIGIGGHLTMPPLPHHRAYGSVPRRFGGLSTGQLFHGKQSQTTEAALVKARCRASEKLSRHGPLGLKIAALA